MHIKLHVTELATCNRVSEMCTAACRPGVRSKPSQECVIARLTCNHESKPSQGCVIARLTCNHASKPSQG
jgi:hypothetical protein